MIKISTKYKGKHYYHADRKIIFDRVCGAIGWPGERQGFAVVVGEKDMGRNGINRFILAEATAKSFGELLSDCLKIQKRMELKRWETVFVPGAEKYIDIFNAKAFEKGTDRIASVDEPLEANEYIQMSVELILDAVRSGNKNLHFFKDSSLPADLQSLPSNTSKLKIVEYPSVAALGFVISYMEEFKKPSPYVVRENAPY